MVFSSQLFLFWFLPLALVVYTLSRLAPRWVRHGLLVGLSFGFYGWSNPPFVILLVISTLVDYTCGLVIAHRQPGGGEAVDASGPRRCPQGGDRSRAQRIAVIVSVTTNLALLGFFKYAGFAVESYGVLVEALGLGHLAWQDTLRITLPLGISFYTFQSMSYTIDVYRGHARATRNLVDFACYVSLFPQLVAGPIVRFSEVAGQLVRRSHDVSRFARGVSLFSLGMAKKVLVANPLGEIADLCFGAGSLGVVDAWMGLVAYSFQIYFDFSGYSDMAIGLGLMLGFVFPKNFDSPYSSASLTEFWRRWHVSLSSFLRDYLYLPLGGSRRGRGRTYLNLAIVMLLGGLWHGASWNFVIWGGLHGVGLALERARGRSRVWSRLPRPVAVGLTFVVVSLAWVFFRAPDLPAALAYFGWLLGLGAASPESGLLAGILHQPAAWAALGVAALLVWRAPQAWDFTREITPAKAALTLGLLWASAWMLLTQSYNPFIYFIF